RRCAEREPFPVPVRLDPDGDALRRRRDRGPRRGRVGGDCAALPTARSSSRGRGRRTRVRTAGGVAERPHGGARRRDDRALDEGGRDPPDRRPDGAAGDRRGTRRVEHALDDRARDGNRPGLRAGRDHDRVLRRPPSGRDDRARRRGDGHRRRDGLRAAALAAQAAHPLDGCSAGIVHRPAARLRVLRSRLGAVDGQLRVLELVTLLDEPARLRELAPQLLRARIGGFAAAASQEAENRERTEQPGDRAFHGGDATLAPLPAPSSRSFPELRSPAGPIQTTGREVSGNVVAYEILLMLDPELPEQRQEEIVKRAQELVKKAGGKWVGHDLWGRRRLAYEIAHKG